MRAAASAACYLPPMRTTTSLSLVLALVAAAAGAPPARAQDPKPDPKKDSAKADEPKPQVWEFPREFQAAGRKAALHEPQVLSRDAATGDVKLRFAVRILDGAGRITWGMTEAAGKSHLDLTSRLVLVDGIAAGATALPQLQDKEKADVEKGLAESFPKELLLRLELVTGAPGATPKEPAQPPKYSLAVPEILVRRTPAVLVQTDGELVKDVVGEFPLEYAVNTAADLFRDPKSDTWFLLADGSWLEAKSLQGPWKLAAQVPLLLSQLKVDHPRGHVRAFVPGTPEYQERTGGKKPAPPAVLPEVIVRDKPAELILLEGDPLFLMVPGGKLQVVANTASDVLYHGKSERFYLLVAGRWYQADDLNGPWKEAFGGLPEEFSRIPRDHVRAHVVWCVPGTPEAEEAAALATLEERGTIAKGASITVQFDGKEPRMVPLEGIDVKMAINCDDEVFLAEGTYWCCARGAWFRSDDPKANWLPAATVPAVLAQLPETGGAYHARSVRALGPAENGMLTAVNGGWSGVLLWKNAPLYGAGWYRRGILRAGNWYPYPRTFGENRWYDPLAGVFQARTVGYTAEMKARASEWSPYTASYGRVRQYADRWNQGGRRMFPWAFETSRFQLDAARPDPFETWGTNLKEREGLPVARFPFGDRSGDVAPREPSTVADEKGRVWRLGAKGPEAWTDTAFAPDKDCGVLEKAWLEAFARFNARPAQLRAWAEKRRAPLPVNPTVTK